MTRSVAREGKGVVPPLPLNPSAPSGYAPMALIDRLSGLLRKIELQVCQKCIGGRGSAPDPTGGAHDAPPVPDLLVGWGGGPHLHPNLLGA